MRIIKGFQICSADQQEKTDYFIKLGGDMQAIHEVLRNSNQEVQKDLEKKNDMISSYNKMDTRSFHTDSITDMAIMERDNSHLIISSSKDKTIKIWK